MYIVVLVVIITLCLILYNLYIPSTKNPDQNGERAGESFEGRH